MSRRVLVTGGAGFIGSALVHRLHDEGHDVRVLDDFSRGKRDRLPEGVNLRSGDIRDRAWVASAAANCDTIFHLAYVQGTATFYEKPRLVVDVALRGIMNVLAAAEGKDFFLVSSSEVYQSPGPEHFPTGEDVPLSVPDVTNSRYSYGGSKIACEIATFAFADVLRRAVILRPHNIYGPDMGREHVIPEFAERIENLKGTGYEPFEIQGTGEETRSFCYIDDCVEAFMVLLEKGEHRNVYHVGNDEQEVAIDALAHMMAWIRGRTITVVPGRAPKGAPPRRLPDIDKLRSLGYEPEVPLSVGLPLTLDWYADHRAVAA